MTLSRSHPRAVPRWILLIAVVVGQTLLLATLALANHVGSVSGVFESDDGNLAVNHTAPTTAVDWNSFTDSTTAGEWSFAAFGDRTGNPDDIYNGGVKQDDDCPGVKDGSLGGGGGKFDLSRIYLANKNIGGDEYLFLSWIRVPQNSTTASSHVAYEFNKGTDGNCPAGSPLVKRAAGDMLIVYDFEGGSAAPTIKLSRWITSGTCEVGNVAPPCWGNTVELVSLGYADAQVNVASVGSVLDAIPNPDQTLGVVEFGEAGINLTDAGVFSTQICEGFGWVTGVSRSSGNSGTAQMKDKVGPNQFEIGNCGSVKIVKDTVPNHAQDFSYSTTGPSSGTTALPASFSLDDDSGATGSSDTLPNQRTFGSLFAGAYTFTETAETGWTLTNIVCTGDDNDVIGASGDFDAGDTAVTLDVDPGETIVCTFTNTRLFEVIVITCDQTTNTLVASVIQLGTDAEATAVAADAPTGWGDVNLCDIASTFDNLGEGTYPLSLELPNLPGGLEPN